MENVQEEWRSIPQEFELKLDHYKISNLGRIKRLLSKDCKLEGIVKGCLDKAGYIFCDYFKM